MSVSDVLTDPDSFFEQRVDDPSFLIPVGLVLLTSLLAAIASVPGAELNAEISSMMAESQAQGMNESFQNESFLNLVSTVGTIITVGLQFIITLVGWLLYGLVFYVIARFVFDGTGSFGNTLALTGWGYVPAAINQVIAAVAAYTVFGGVSLPESAQAAQETFTELQSDPILLVAGVIGLGLLVWSGVIWTYAMAHHHDLSRRNAAITVGFPVALVMLLRIFGLV